MSQLQLILEITATKMAAFEWNGSVLTELVKENCSIKTDVGYKQTLSILMDRIGNLDRFENYSCAYFSQDFTLVPMSLFSASKPETLLQFTVDRAISKGEVDYNRLPEWNNVIIYELPLWIKSVLIMRIPRVVIQHEIAHILRFLNTGSTIPTRAHVVLHDQHFSFVLRQNGTIMHASVQEYQNAEDVIYQLLITLQRLSITDKCEFTLHTTSSENMLIANSVLSLTKQMQDFSQHTLVMTENNHLQFQKLCV